MSKSVIEVIGAKVQVGMGIYIINYVEFARRSPRLGPLNISNIINEYMAEVTRCVLAHADGNLRAANASASARAGLISSISVSLVFEELSSTISSELTLSPLRSASLTRNVHSA